jgi:membrane dipeptidase
MLAGMTATLSLAAAGCAPAVSPERRGAAQSLIANELSVDLHCHPGLFPRSHPTLQTHLDRVAQGRLKLLLLAAVADLPLIQVSPQGRISTQREPRPGELHASTYRQVATFQAPLADGRLVAVKRVADLEMLRAQRRSGAILTVEGGDFLDGRLDRVQEAHDRGIRAIQLVHYRVNELGDIQTEPAVHGGLTPFGKDVIREMNRLGMVVDVAHATFDAVKHAADVATKPFILSHTILFVRTRFQRAVSRDHARLVAKHRGVIGVFPTAVDGVGFDGFIDHVSRLVDAVGADHVGIGTDMDGIPVGPTFTDYSQWPSIPAALLARGYGHDDVVKVMGGNFLRVFREVAQV